MLSMLLCSVYTQTALPNDAYKCFSLIMAQEGPKHVQNKIVCNETVTQVPISAFCCMSNAQKILHFSKLGLVGHWDQDCQMTKLSTARTRHMEQFTCKGQWVKFGLQIEQVLIHYASQSGTTLFISELIHSFFFCHQEHKLYREIRKWHKIMLFYCNVHAKCSFI